MKILISLYGRLREAGLGDKTALELPENADAREILAALKTRFGNKAGWLEGTVLATKDAVLSPNDAPKSQELAALPPVCGG